MKSPKKNGIGEVVTEYGARVMKVIKKGLLGRSLFDFYGDIKAQAFKTKEMASVPSTPADGKGGVIYTKSADGKLYYKSNEVSEVELSASDTVLTSEQVQDIVGGMLVGTETRIGVTYDDTNGRINFVVDDMTADTNTQNTTTLSFVDSSDDVLLRNTTGGAGSGTDDIKFVAGSNVTLTHTDADNITIAATDTNTTYSEATGSAEGLMSIAHHDKLDGIESSADVTDATNVTAAGALMDSELTDLAGVKGVTISTLQVKPSEGAFANGDKTKLDAIESSATADQTQADINGLAITTVGTVDTGTWQGTAIANAYLDADTAHLSGDQTFTGAKTFNRKVILDGDKSVTAGSDGVTMHVDAQDITDTSTSGSGTATTFSHVVVENPRLMATNSSVTTTNASTVYIKGAPIASTNQTITNAYSLYVAGGHSYFNNDVTVGGDVDITGNVLPGITYVKILPSDFMPDDGGRPAMIDDTGSDRWLESHGTSKLYAFVDIPVGFKATHVDVYGSATSAVTVYEADVNSKTVTSKGTGNIGTQINITDVSSDATNYVMIELAQASGEEVYGGKLTIAKI